MARRLIVLLFFLILTGCNEKEICHNDKDCINLLLKVKEQSWQAEQKVLKKLKNKCKIYASGFACQAVGEYYKIKKEDFLASRFFARACKLYDDKSCLENGMALERINQIKKAVDSYYFGCLLAKGGGSCEALGDFLSHNKDWKGSAFFYKESCDKGHTSACSKMARITMSYLPSFKDKEKYYKEYFEKACSGSDYFSCFFLGEIYFDEGKVNSAKSFIYKACVGGMDEACDFFKENYGSLWDKNKRKIILWWDYLLKKFNLR